MEAVLEASRNAPERLLVAGEQLFGQGDGGADGVVVLVDGDLRIELDGVVIEHVTRAGSFVGEIGALLGVSRTATVVAERDTRVLVVGDPESFFSTHPEVALHLARQLAGRLQRLLAYLADLRTQYADAEGHLAVFDAVLGRIASRPPVEIEPGSDRSADYEL